jgi:hypothetical protein
MRLRPIVSAAALAVLAPSLLILGACNRGKPAEKAPEAPGAPAAQTPAAPTPPSAPKRRAGLWEMRMSSSDNDTAMVTRFCTSDEVEAKVSVWGSQMTKDMCSQNSMTRNPDGSWSFSSRCDMGTGGVVSSTGTASGDFDKHYQVRSTSTTSGASVPQMNRTSTVTMDSSWMGACPADMKPGDMTLPGGMGKMNILELSRAR